MDGRDRYVAKTVGLGLWLVGFVKKVERAIFEASRV